MNRILKRPMFRKGGSTEGQGIMANVKRPGYEGGIGPNVMDNRRTQDIETRMGVYRNLYDKYAPTTRSTMGPGTLPGFLTGFGLDLLSRPSTGNIFQTAAQSAQQPFQAFQSARGQEQAEERALNRAILGDVIEAESEEERARLKGQESYAFKEQFNLIQRTKSELYELEDKLKDPKLKPEDRITIERQIDSKEAALNDLVGQDPFLKEILTNPGFEDIIDEAIEELKKQLGRSPTPAEIKKYVTGKKDGGRIGYEVGGDVEVNKPMMNQTSAPVIAMDYTTLRSRLPKQIGDDIVKLLAESEEALTDFANIRTQEDVDQFNQSYRVNLVLPQEV